MQSLLNLQGYLEETHTPLPFTFIDFCSNKYPNEEVHIVQSSFMSLWLSIDPACCVSSCMDPKPTNQPTQATSEFDDSICFADCML